MARLKLVATIILLAFVAASVGYLAGQEVGLWPRPRLQEAFPPLSAGPPRSDRALVYYFHNAQRCRTCLQVERMTRELLQREFAAAMEAGRLEWRTLVLEENPDAAKRYNAASAAVVAAEVRGGQEKGFDRLDDLWKFLEDRAAFDARVGGAIRRALPGGDP